MQIFLWGLLVLGALVGLIAVWAAIHYAGVALAILYERLPGSVQDGLLILGLVLLVCGVIVTMGIFYSMARWTHGVPLSILMSLFFTVIAAILAFIVAMFAGYIFGWVDE